MAMRSPRKKSRAGYMISSVAELYGLHPQTLRLYERVGLLKPSRSQGNTRLYTDADLERLEVILTLTREMGVNLAGIEIILNMREKMAEMQRQMQAFTVFVRQELARSLDSARQKSPQNALVQASGAEGHPRSEIASRRGASRLTRAAFPRTLRLFTPPFFHCARSLRAPRGAPMLVRYGAIRLSSLRRHRLAAGRARGCQSAGRARRGTQERDSRRFRGNPSLHLGRALRLHRWRSRLARARSRADSAPLRALRFRKFRHRPLGRLAGSDRLEPQPGAGPRRD